MIRWKVCGSSQLALLHAEANPTFHIRDVRAPSVAGITKRPFSTQFTAYGVAIRYSFLRRSPLSAACIEIAAMAEIPALEITSVLACWPWGQTTIRLPRTLMRFLSICHDDSTERA